MKTAEKELSKKSVDCYERNGFVIISKPESESRVNLLKENQKISDEYDEIDFNTIFRDSIISVHRNCLSNRSNHQQRAEQVCDIVVHNKILGCFRIIDLGENYMVYCKSNWTDHEFDFLKTSLGDLDYCILNRNLITIKKCRK